MIEMPEIKTNHQLIKHERIEIEAGDYIKSWCSKAGEKGEQTRHLWDGYKLICLHCHPEAEKEGEE